MRKSSFIGLACLAGTSAASAHGVAASTETSGEVIGVALPLLITAVLYLIGAWRLHRRCGSGHGMHRARVAAFAAGWVALALSLLSPLDTLSGELFAVHMVQHEILMLVAAPLLVLGRPLPVFLWAFPATWRLALGHASQTRVVSRVWRGLTRPLTAWGLHALALWVWHAPRLFTAALLIPTLHDFQHISFLATALLFWSALLHARAREAQGAAILYLFTTTVHTGVLGALITFGAHPWYPAYVATAPHWGFTALEDQQLGGLIMWVPGSLVYVGVALALLARWINASGRTVSAGSTRISLY